MLIGILLSFNGFSCLKLLEQYTSSHKPKTMFVVTVTVQSRWICHSEQISEAVPGTLSLPQSVSSLTYRQTHEYFWEDFSTLSSSVSLSHIQLFATLWTVAHQVLCPWDFSGKDMEWVTIFFPRGSSLPRDQTCISCVSCIVGRFFTHWANEEALLVQGHLIFPCRFYAVQV